MEGEIKTTVVIPAWDEYAGEWLRAAVESLRTQDARHRVVVVDNASTRPVPALEGVEVVRLQTRVSLGAARNEGLSRVGTPFVIFWDADDVMPPGTLGALETAIDADPKMVAFAMAIREAGSGLRHRWPRRRVARLAQYPRAFALLHCVWSQFPTTGATIIRTDAARRGGGFTDAESGDDWCLGVSLAFRGRIGWSERPGRLYRLHPESVWAQYFTLAHQRQHAAAIRSRVLEDPQVPGWAKGLVPVIGVAQYAALGAHALLAAGRRWVRRLSG